MKRVRIIFITILLLLTTTLSLEVSVKAYSTENMKAINNSDKVGYIKDIELAKNEEASNTESTSKINVFSKKDEKRPIYRLFTDSLISAIVIAAGVSFFMRKRQGKKEVAKSEETSVKTYIKNDEFNIVSKKDIKVDTITTKSPKKDKK